MSGIFKLYDQFLKGEQKRMRAADGGPRETGGPWVVGLLEASEVLRPESAPKYNQVRVRGM